MSLPYLTLVESAPLPYLLSLPDDLPASGARPVLCFLHGYGEGAPMPIRQALTLHGPLVAYACKAITEFIVVAPQLPVRGDFWHQHACTVHEIVEQVRAQHGGDPSGRF